MTEKTQATEQQPDGPRLHDRTVKPEGTIPKQAQTYVIVGVSIVIVLAVLFSNKHAQPAAKNQRDHSSGQNKATAPKATKHMPITGTTGTENAPAERMPVP